MLELRDAKDQSHHWLPYWIILLSLENELLTKAGIVNKRKKKGGRAVVGYVRFCFAWHS